jgi:hypothetical protein
VRLRALQRMGAEVPLTLPRRQRALLESCPQHHMRALYAAIICSAIAIWPVCRMDSRGGGMFAGRPAQLQSLQEPLTCDDDVDALDLGAQNLSCKSAVYGSK